MGLATPSFARAHRPRRARCSRSRDAFMRIEHGRTSDELKCTSSVQSPARQQARSTQSCSEH
ncbi:hypothetical protein EXIGLDRAFT_731503, partial [Exidia glandulosa HHB12029]